MIVGEPSSFAIQYAIDDSQSELRHGQFAYLANGALVGDYSAGTSLTTAAIGIERLLQYRGRRTEPHLLRCTANEAFSIIHTALFCDDERTDDQVRLDTERFSKFDVSGFLDVFDRWHCFLVEGDGVGRFLYSRIDAAGAVNETILREGEFDHVCHQFLMGMG